jgi:hypothetical protein
MELRLHGKMYITLMAAVFTMSALGLVSDFFTNTAFKPINTLYLHILIIFIPFILYGFVYHPTKGLTYAMLPATSTEKVLSAWIQCVIVAPILLTAPIFFLAIFFDVSTESFIEQYVKTTSSTFFNSYLSVIEVQAIAFWGAFWFKRKKEAKTILTLALIALGIVVITVLTVKLLQYYDVPKITINSHTLNERHITLLRYFGYLISTILPWTLAFFKFRRTQI